MNDLLKKEHHEIQIMHDKSVIVSQPSPSCAGNVFSICGEGEPSRDYATSWYSDTNRDIAAHIYVSSTLSHVESEMLDRLGIILDCCGSVADMMALNGNKLTTACTRC